MIEIEDAWLFWFKREKNLFSFQEELNAIQWQIDAENEHPYNGRKWLRRQFTKRVILQSKIRLLKGSVSK